MFARCRWRMRSSGRRRTIGGSSTTCLQPIPNPTSNMKRFFFRQITLDCQISHLCKLYLLWLGRQVCASWLHSAAVLRRPLRHHPRSLEAWWLIIFLQKFYFYSLTYVWLFLFVSGKTFQALVEGREDPIALSYRLIGLALRDKYEKVFELLQQITQDSNAVVDEQAVSCLRILLLSVIGFLSIKFNCLDWMYSLTSWWSHNERETGRGESVGIVARARLHALHHFRAEGAVPSYLRGILTSLN